MSSIIFGELAEALGLGVVLGAVELHKGFAGPDEFAFL